MRTFICSTSLALLLTTLRVAPAWAQPSDEMTRVVARSLGTAGVEAYQAGDYAAAWEKLDRAYRALRVPTLGLWSARALVKLGKLVEASERYREVTRLESAPGEKPVQRAARSDAASELRALEAKLPNITLELSGAPRSEVSVTLDGAAVAAALVGEAWPVNPGTHQIEASHAGEHVRVEVSVVESEQKRVPLRFAAARSAPATAPTSPAQTRTAAPVARRAGAPASTRERRNSYQRVLGWSALAAGGAGFVVGGIAGISAMNKKKDLDDDPRCTDLRCPNELSGAVDSYNSARTTSSIGFIAGGVLAAGGVVLLLTAPRAEHPITVGILPSGVRISGGF